ncbi:sugar ABC transporter permease [Acrocarpospora macrocephala]|uniref:ABC transporter permease n=1 Tax=Acrocarpospora macrocephala TaxID=150177 RepID=A0A5M3WZP1_9ACTN|nr:sugar ABC transporter permease [Acrocarpospora macrocephala]GES14270.1 ABC transporter permease [Acrocarpospora macrocephala]
MTIPKPSPADARPRVSAGRRAIRTGVFGGFRRTTVWYAFVLPPFALLVLFVCLPTAQTFVEGFYRETGPDQRQFVGLDQFANLGTTGVFWDALINTVLLGVAFLALVIPLAAILSAMLNHVRRGATALKVIYFLPQLTSSVAVALIFLYVFQPDWGLLNGFLHILGIDDVPLWLADPSFGLTGSRAAVTLLAVWSGLGYFILIFLAGIQSIPVELYESAAVDGATPLQIWRHITLPGLRPTIIFLVMTGSFDAMARFGDLWTLGGPSGSPARTLQSIVMLMYQVGFVSHDTNQAAAIAVVFFVIMLVLTVVAYRAFLSREFKARS